MPSASLRRLSLRPRFWQMLPSGPCPSRPLIPPFGCTATCPSRVFDLNQSGPLVRQLELVLLPVGLRVPRDGVVASASPPRHPGR